MERCYSFKGRIATFFFIQMFYHATHVTATGGQHILRVGTRWPFSLILHREQNRMPGIGGQNTNKASDVRGFQLR